jgi:hypothetical protein
MENNITKWIREASIENLHTMTDAFLCDCCPAHKCCEDNPSCAEAFRNWALMEE